MVMSCRSGGLSWELRFVSTLVGTDGRSVLSGQQVVSAKLAGLLVGGADGWLGRRRILVLFISIQLKIDDSGNGRQQI